MALALVSLLGGLVFARYYLVQTAQQFVADFTRQNYVELGNGDTFSLAQRLNALSSAIHWKCITAAHNQIPFYEKTLASCREGLFTTRLTTGNLKQHGITVTFVFGLPATLAFAIKLFTSLQGALLLLLIFSSRKLERAKHETQLQIAQMTAQISHDIRSPLGSLQYIILSAKNLDESTRNELKTAVNRIRDIANGLLVKNRSGAEHGHATLRHNEPMNTISIEPSSVELLPTFIETAVSQKNRQFTEHNNLDIHFEIAPSNFGIFSLVQPAALDSILSNLMNNSIEALPEGGGKILISLSCNNNTAQLKIQDSGKGIPQKFLKKVLERGGTFGKKDGNGLGLSHAKATIESWRGTLKLESIVEKGTTVIIEFPMVEAPKWFNHEIRVTEGMTVVIADDNQTVHNIWKNRLGKLDLALQVVHLHKSQQILEWYRENIMEDDVLYLCGHDLSEELRTSVDIIEMTGIQSQAVLITNCWDDKELRSKCEKINLKLLPKSLIGIVPIQT